jgi:Rrf2 family protein
MSQAAKLALYALTELAVDPSVQLSATQIAAVMRTSESHMAKVLQQLVRGGLVQGVRGVGGGYRLTRPPGKITVADVVRCIEGRSAAHSCANCPMASTEGRCHREASTCRVHALLGELELHVLYTLESVTLAALANARRDRDPQPLIQLEKP